MTLIANPYSCPASCVPDHIQSRIKEKIAASFRDSLMATYDSLVTEEIQALLGSTVIEQLGTSSSIGCHNSIVDKAFKNEMVLDLFDSRSKVTY